MMHQPAHLSVRPALSRTGRAQPAPSSTQLPGRRWWDRLQRGPAAARNALLWALALFVCGQAALAVGIERSRPELRDPEYGYKLARLRACLARNPGRPLLLVLGSSRTELGFRPRLVPPARAPAGREPVVFNFGLSGSGPVLELLYLRRLLREGIRPDWLLIEILPPALHQEESNSEADRYQVERLQWTDLKAIRPYRSGDPDRLVRDWSQARLLPTFANRFGILSRFAPTWLPWYCRQDQIWHDMDDVGWVRYPRLSVPEAEYRRSVERTRVEYDASLNGFRVSGQPDRALRELLATCRHEGVAAALFLMPEGSEFRSWYSPVMEAAVEAYLAGIRRDYGIPVVDARTWVPDKFFTDSHHLFPRGAALFTERFAREAVLPLLEGRLQAHETGGAAAALPAVGALGAAQ
jgi:hypothetical protein